jgi:hypothetical protein
MPESKMLATVEPELAGRITAGSDQSRWTAQKPVPKNKILPFGLMLWLRVNETKHRFFMSRLPS